MISSEKNKIPYILASLIFLLTPSMSGEAQSEAIPPCTGPTNSILVTVARVKDAPPTYSYTIKNASSAPISAFVLGDGDRKEMMISPANVPDKVESPKGWSGKTNFQEEGSFMNILWETKSPHSLIAPSGSKEGFKLLMPVSPAKSPELFDLYGKKVEPFSMKNAPFRVLFTDGKCQWGRTSEVQPQKEK